MAIDAPDREQGSDVLLCLFAKAPRLGQVKTRMQTVLDAQQARELHLALLRSCLEQLKQADSTRLLLMASETHPVLTAMAREYEVPLALQRGQDLGERMLSAIQDGLDTHSAVILVGADCPFVDAAYIAQAVDKLQTAPIVFGPAEDGGYVLLGARQALPELFHAMPWGAEQVLSLSRDRLKALGVAWRELPMLPDIDRPADLQHLAEHTALAHWSAPDTEQLS